MRSNRIDYIRIGYALPAWETGKNDHPAQTDALEKALRFLMSLHRASPPTALLPPRCYGSKVTLFSRSSYRISAIGGHIRHFIPCGFYFGTPVPPLSRMTDHVVQSLCPRLWTIFQPFEAHELTHPGRFRHYSGGAETRQTCTLSFDVYDAQIFATEGSTKASMA